MYITYQLRVSANAAVAIIRLDTIYQRRYIDMIKYRTTMDSIRSANNHSYLVEEIRKRAVNLNKKNWRIEFKW